MKKPSLSICSASRFLIQLIARDAFGHISNHPWTSQSRTLPCPPLDAGNWTPWWVPTSQQLFGTAQVAKRDLQPEWIIGRNHHSLFHKEKLPVGFRFLCPTQLQLGSQACPYWIYYIIHLSHMLKCASFTIFSYCMTSDYMQWHRP